MVISDPLPPTKARALTDLLVTTFTREELHQLILLSYGNQIAAHISWQGSRAAVALATAQTLARHGLVNAQLFDYLQQARPHHRDVTRVEQFLLQPNSDVVLVSPNPSQSDCLRRVLVTETERAAVFRFAESMAYLFYLGTTGLLILSHELGGADIPYMAGLACVVLVGGYCLSLYRLKLHRRVASFLGTQTSAGPILTSECRPGKDLLSRDRFRFLEYTAVLGLFSLALHGVYEGVASCCATSTMLVRFLIGGIMLLLGIGIFRAARQPLLSYVDHIADKRVRKAESRHVCRTALPLTLTLLATLNHKTFAVAPEALFEAPSSIENIVHGRACEDVTSQEPTGVPVTQAEPTDTPMETWESEAPMPARKPKREPKLSKCRKQAKTLKKAEEMLRKHNAEEAYHLAKSCHDHTPSRQSLEMMVAAACMMLDRRLADKLIRNSPRPSQWALEKICLRSESHNPAKPFHLN